MRTRRASLSTKRRFGPIASVAAPPVLLVAACGTDVPRASRTIVVHDANGNPVRDVEVNVLGVRGRTDATGRVIVPGLLQSQAVVPIRARGFVATSVDTSGLDVALLPLGSPIAFHADENVYVSSGSRVRITLGAGSLVDAAGHPVSGPAQATIVPVDPAGIPQNLVPVLQAEIDGNASGELDTPVMADVSSWQNGELLQLAPGETATVEMVLPEATQASYQVGAVVAGFWLDVDDCVWKKGTVGLILPSTLVAGKNAWVASVEHFTFWAPGTTGVIASNKNCVNILAKDSMSNPIGGVRVLAVGQNYAHAGAPSFTNATPGPELGKACVEFKADGQIQLVPTHPALYKVTNMQDMLVGPIFPPNQTGACNHGTELWGDTCDATVDIYLGLCGNGIPQGTEQCDDGDLDDTNACTTFCKHATCGDGFTQSSNNEQCDDGPGNGNNGSCKADCTKVCGDANPDPGEECDDGNQDNGDSCTTLCRHATCGDGFTPSGNNEECDDGNQNDFDGCTNQCKGAVCGDGIVQLPEKCDDGNLFSGDGCSGTCTMEPGWTCSGMPSFGHHPSTAPLQSRWYHTCSRHNGAVKCWGNNFWGGLGLGDGQDRGWGPNQMGQSLPTVDLGTSKTAVTIAAGASFTYALLNDASVKCWGGNEYGQLGLFDVQNRGDMPNQMGNNLPEVDLGTGKTAAAITAGQNHACALLSDGSVKCWGNNSWGQLGLSDTQSRGDAPNEMGDNLPTVDLGTGTYAMAIGAGGNHTCAVLIGGSVKCWGNNSLGALGLGDTQFRGDQPNEMGDNLPTVDLGPSKTAVAIGLGQYHTCAILDDGSVKCFGHNYYGQLGLGDTQNRGDQPNEMGSNLLPVDLGTGKTAVAIAVGEYYHICVLLNYNSVKCWGQNNLGQLGLGDIESRGDQPNEMGDNLPTIDLGTGQAASAVVIGASHSCAILIGGSVKCWGSNSYGTLGLGDTSHRGAQPNEMGDNLPAVSLW